MFLQKGPLESLEVPHPFAVVQWFSFKSAWGISINGGSPVAGWLLLENPIEMDDDSGYPH